MKERYEILKAAMEEMTTLKKKEYWMTIALGVLLGVVVGLMFSPKKRVTIASYNGNNSGEDDDFEECGEDSDSCDSCDWD